VAGFHERAGGAAEDLERTGHVEHLEVRKRDVTIFRLGVWRSAGPDNAGTSCPRPLRRALDFTEWRRIRPACPVTLLAQGHCPHGSCHHPVAH
jgi:hypothetical protein